MSEEKVDLNKKVDDLEAAAKKYASKDTVISIGGYEFTPAKLMVAATLLSSALGGLYGVFEVYKDYMGMKKKIAEYVSPDFSEFDKRLAVIEENITKTSKAVQEGSDKTAEYTRDIKNDLKGDIRRLEDVVDNIERGAKQSQRETDQSVKEVQQELRQTSRELDRTLKSSQRETEQKLQQLQRETDAKIQKALDNPLAGK